MLVSSTDGSALRDTMTEGDVVAEPVKVAAGEDEGAAETEGNEEDVASGDLLGWRDELGVQELEAAVEPELVGDALDEANSAGRAEPVAAALAVGGVVCAATRAGAAASSSSSNNASKSARDVVAGNTIAAAASRAIAAVATRCSMAALPARSSDGRFEEAVAGVTRSEPSN